MKDSKPFLIALGLSAAIGFVAWLFIQFMLTPQQRFLDECNETYLMTECMARWEELRPMPADYGKNP